MLPLFLKIVAALLFRFVQGLSLFLDGTLALGRKPHGARSKLLFEDARASDDFHGFVRCHLCLSLAWLEGSRRGVVDDSKEGNAAVHKAASKSGTMAKEAKSF